MPSALPDGEPVPSDGSLPAHALDGLGRRPFGFYLHVPYCASRCGYCDFNTYTATELRSSGAVASQETYADNVVAEIRLARKVLGDVDLPVRTVFLGGGTPTLLPARDLVKMLAAIREEFGLADGAEVTTEANPESVGPAYLAELREGGYNRISFGMQSARPHVLQLLDRHHTPGRPEACVAEARAAGFEHVNLDLIYGTPGESDDDWRASLDAAIGAGPDHVSAYSLIVEEGTRLAARVKRGELPMIDDDVHADRYLIAEQALAAAGYHWYEVSNWATTPEGRCRHNELYWTGADWWGAGPGAHSHVGGVRWWNAKHPAAYAQALTEGRTPALGREVLAEEDRRVERILLELRLVEGVSLDLLTATGRRAAARALADGLLAAEPYEQGRAALTLQGRLLADAVVRDLVD
ncbi:oxygen-independent coproporphyrinogen-3 oxidase [Streptomyces sp. 1114.5]|uniref:radical SAM family heme chaperone HemW n=1 Tax=unclassified Streptomyces TaxID=2593676 RepID=UPI000BD55471|nr:MULTISPECIES: radical SAM family heme chaperone HemW [unclassified Streptomyces]RKT18032.1 oxygen-independent coproporphyrinogen-3 oxidase [Streptomyces sp. 1114.5]SOB84249.1 coproporphyrinogen III oxidase, anaerobic [Streptomyces sp. 1331.2]